MDRKLKDYIIDRLTAKFITQEVKKEINYQIEMMLKQQ